MFLGETRSLPMRGALERCFTQVGLGLSNRLECFEMDKHSSLFCIFVNYEEKKFYNTHPGLGFFRKGNYVKYDGEKTHKTVYRFSQFFQSILQAFNPHNFGLCKIRWYFLQNTAWEHSCNRRSSLFCQGRKLHKSNVYKIYHPCQW
jgi:hypothetical protein